MSSYAKIAIFQRDSSSWTSTVKVSSSGKEMPGLMDMLSIQNQAVVPKPGAFFQCIKSYAPEQPDELELQVVRDLSK